MGKPSFSQTITRILEMRGRAASPAAQPPEPSSSEVESRSTDTIAGGTTRPSRKSSSGPSTSVKSISENSTTEPGSIHLPSYLVHSFLFDPRPLPALDLTGEAGEFLVTHAAAVGVPVPDMLENIVAWAYRVAPNWGEKSLETVILFYRDNRPAEWGY